MREKDDVILRTYFLSRHKTPSLLRCAQCTAVLLAITPSRSFCCSSCCYVKAKLPLLCFHFQSWRNNALNLALGVVLRFETTTKSSCLVLSSFFEREFAASLREPKTRSQEKNHPENHLLRLYILFPPRFLPSSLPN